MFRMRDIEFIDLGIFIKDKRIFSIADLHIGYEEALNKQGILIPRFQIDDIISRLKKIFRLVKPKIVVINGDLKHEFGEISRQEWKDTLKVLDFLLSKYNVVLVKGNHDNIVEPIASKKGLDVVDRYIVDDIMFIHGHKIVDIPKNIKTIIMGHEHPAVSIRSKLRIEKYKCFLVGKYKGKKIIVMPSFNFVAEGSDILSEDILSPYLKKDLDSFDVYIVGGFNEIFYFGNVRDVRRMNRR